MSKQHNWVNCKLGTIPSRVIIHRGDKIEVGNVIRYKEYPEQRFCKYTRGARITKINSDGYLFLDKY